MSAEQNKKLKEVEEGVRALAGSTLPDFRRENNYVPVSGEGSSEASIMFVGEAPGRKEAETGRPFCGSAGKILDGLLVSVGIERKDVYITSIVKDRPPKNRDPLPAEIALYAPFLDKQIEIIRPKVIATLGRFAMQYVMERYGLTPELAPISELHGRVFSAKGELIDSGVKIPFEFKVVPLYHPAAAIYNQSLKTTLLEDFQVLSDLSK